jgi:hypothetical protein
MHNLQGEKMSLVSQFRQDRQGKRFTDVLDKEPRIDFEDILGFLDDPQRQQRMLDSEVHHDRAPLAALVRELEARPDVHEFFSKHDAHTTTRFRAAIGVAIRIIMENRHSWETTGRKGSLGTRVKVKSGTTTPGAYHNSDTSLSRWFVRSERYEPTPQAVAQRVVPPSGTTAPASESV